jgi:hypothetical protein
MKRLLSRRFRLHRVNCAGSGIGRLLSQLKLQVIYLFKRLMRRKV